MRVFNETHRRSIAGKFFACLMAVSTLLSIVPAHNTKAISMSTRPTLVGNEIHMGPNGGHITMQGVNIWGIETITMSGFGDTEYADRVNIVNTVKSWGANHVRFRLQASDYNNETYMTKAEYLNRIKQWHDLIVGAGMYFMPVWWDTHDGPYSDTNWPTQYNQAFPMMTDVMNLFPNDPMVMYEPFNEPTGSVNDVQWVNAMKATISLFRNNGYTGILLIDPRVWAHCYSDSDFTTLEQHDAAAAGMNGTHQIIFIKHDYAREFTDPDAGFDPAEWLTNSGGCGTWDPTKHTVWESEFGNYSLDPSSVHPNWSAGATTFFHNSVCDSTIAGGSAFLFGPWLDANAMTGSDNTTKTLWGNQVDNNFLVPCTGLNGIGTLGNLIFYDKKRDGVFNPSDGDYGFNNVTLALYAEPTTGCSVSPSATPLATATTDSSGHYQFTLLPTDDGIAGNGSGARYAVVVTDQHSVLKNVSLTTGSANTDNNSQIQPTYCVELTNAINDIQYADFGYGDPVHGEPTGALANTGEPRAPITVAAIILIVLAGASFLAREKIGRIFPRK